MRPRFGLALACAMAGLGTVPANAQDAVHRNGFWISFGLGAGSAGFECDGCEDDRDNSGAGYLRLGGTPSDRFLVGGEINGWVKRDEEETYEWEAAIGSIFGTLLFYPSAGNFYLQGGLGFMGYTLEAENDAGESAKLETAGFGLLLGIGYDVRVARSFSLTPYVSYTRSFSSDVEISGGGFSVGLSEELNPNVFQFGLGFTWH